jgi:hypothetical protein
LDIFFKRERERVQGGGGREGGAVESEEDVGS